MGLNKCTMPWSMRMIFWICRCHPVALDGCSSHEHLHALVQNKKGTLHAAKDQMKRNGQTFHPETTHKRILCPKQDVCVLRYINCQAQFQSAAQYQLNWELALLFQVTITITTITITTITITTITTRTLT